MKEKWVYTKTNVFKYFTRTHAKKKEYIHAQGKEIDRSVTIQIT